MRTFKPKMDRNKVVPLRDVNEEDVESDGEDSNVDPEDFKKTQRPSCIKRPKFLSGLYVCKMMCRIIYMPFVVSASPLLE